MKSVILIAIVFAIICYLFDIGDACGHEGILGEMKTNKVATEKKLGTLTKAHNHAINEMNKELVKGNTCLVEHCMEKISITVLIIEGRGKDHKRWSANVKRCVSLATAILQETKANYIQTLNSFGETQINLLSNLTSYETTITMGKSLIVLLEGIIKGNFVGNDASTKARVDFKKFKKEHSSAKDVMVEIRKKGIREIQSKVNELKGKVDKLVNNITSEFLQHGRCS